MMDMISNVVSAVNSFLWDYALLFLLCGTGIYYTFRLRFVQVRKFIPGIKRLFGNFNMKGEKAGKDGMSSFQALTTAIAAQVGTGTIYAEAVLAQKYKTVDADGQVTGGPIYYIRAAFKDGKFAKFMAGFFSIAIILALGFMGNMVQSNSIGVSFENAFGVDKFIVGIFVASVAAFIFIGGVKRIASVTEKLVPFMALLYIIGCSIILVMRVDMVGEAFRQIFVMAFNPQAALGGVIGVTIQKAMRYGVARGLFSNEAGMGSTPHAHALAKVSDPEDQGILAMIGVFIDTFIILTLTAMVILTTGSLSSGLTGSELAQLAFNSAFGQFGNIFIAICMLFFAFSTIVGWYFFGEVNVKAMFGKKAVTVYSIIVVLFVLIGSALKVQMVWDLSDMFNGLMVIPNLLALLALSGTVAKMTNKKKDS